MPFEYGFDLLLEITYQSFEDKCFLRWSLAYQKEISFEEFKIKIKAPDRNAFFNAPPEETEDEIILNVKNILNTMRV